MQDIHSLTGGGTPTAARLFAAAAAAAAAGEDRHLRPLHPNNQALKCPRCDSLNTKFCYYNNYNLSQPRHFCKACRRYWTKGGVLRNVPVGGGCRKSRRPSSSASSSSSSSSRLPAAEPKPHDDSATASSPAAANTVANNNNMSSSDGSSLAAATGELPPLFQEYGSSPCLEKPSSMYGGVDVSVEMGNFAGMTGSTGDMEMTPFGYAGVLTQQDEPRQRQQGISVVLEGLGGLDWAGEEGSDGGGGGGGGLFEVTGGVVDCGAYWDQQNHWTTSDHRTPRQGGGGLFLP